MGMIRAQQSWYRAVCVAAVVVLCLVVALPARATLILSPGVAGPSSLSYNGVEYLSRGPWCNAFNVMFGRQGSGPVGRGVLKVQAINGGVLISRGYQWGALQCAFSAVGDRLNVTVTVTNSTSDTLVDLRLLLASLAAPSGPVTRMPMAEDNLGGPDVVFVGYGPNRLFVANEQVGKLLVLTTPPVPSGMGILLETQLTSILSPIYYQGPYRRTPWSRSIPAGGSDRYFLSLRFTDANTAPQVALADLFRRWAERFPPTLNWRDRRPIGQFFMASYGPQLPFDPHNPAYWRFLQNRNPTPDVNTPQGRAEFKTVLLQEADVAVMNLKRMNAQGVIVWDLEGQQFQSLQYVGDPRHLRPEMQSAVDEFFRRFTRAGFRCGVTLAVRKLIHPGAGDHTFPIDARTTRRYIDDPDELLSMLDDLVTYAHKRWGCTLFYFDATGNAAFPTVPEVFIRLAARHPDCLLIPEHKTLTYYAFSAPYCDEILGVSDCPSAEARWIYPNAFSVVSVRNGGIRPGFTPMNVVQRVDQGDVLMTETWSLTNPHVNYLIGLERRAAAYGPAPAD
jgi:hypothetical protein